MNISKPTKQNKVRKLSDKKIGSRKAHPGVVEFAMRNSRTLGRATTDSFVGPWSRTPAPRPQAAISFEQLVNVLDMQLDLSYRDLEYLIREQELFSMDEEASRATEALLEMDQFRSWLLGQGSYFLLADGDDTDHASDSTSAMTLLCVSIIGSLQARRDPRTILLYFFCGMHADKTEGPLLMMRSLLVQLLLALWAGPSLDLGFLGDERYLTWLLRDDPLRTMFEMFRSLLRQVPWHVTVYCFADGVDWYENEQFNFNGDMMAFVDEMRTLARPREAPNPYLHGGREGYEELGCNFKVLLTSANGTEVIWRHVSKLTEHVIIYTDC